MQGWEVKFWGTKKVPSDFDDLQKSISNLGMLDATTSYLFHGAPDIFMKRGNSASVITEASDFTLIENSRQITQPFVLRNLYLPDKLAELIAQTHFLAAPYFLRCGVKGEAPQEIITKGLLLDKTSGGYHVQLTANISSSKEGHPIHVLINRQCRLGMLREELLCEHLKTLVGDL